MKKDQYEKSRTKYNLKKSASKGLGYVIWSLSKPMLEYIKDLGYEIEPAIYSIRTKTFKNLKDKKALIKEIHFACKSNKKTIGKRLSKKELKLLETNNIKCTVQKYIIYLN